MQIIKSYKVSLPYLNDFLRWPEPIHMRVGYVFESRFSAEMILPISMIFGILNKEWSNVYFLVGIKTFDILASF